MRILMVILLFFSIDVALGQKGVRVQLPPQPDPPVVLTRATDADIREILNRDAQQIMKNISDVQQREKQSPSGFAGPGAPTAASAFSFHRQLNRANPNLLRLRGSAQALGIATKFMAFSLNPQGGGGQEGSNVQVNNPNLQSQISECQRNLLELSKKPCSGNEKFRSIDGFCNNVQNPLWGMKDQPYVRFRAPKYQDDVDAPRVTGVNGGPLPNARRVSVTLSQDVKREEPSYTHMVMQWGQFVSHDITFKPDDANDDGSVPTCCNVPNPHPSCLPINLPPNDALAPQNCMEFIRSMATPHEGCLTGPRENPNQVTPLLDGSTVYGDTDELSKQLRAPTGGLLQTQSNARSQGSPLLPFQTRRSNPPDCQEGECFQAGDARVNQQPALVAMHTIWVREHNRIAGELAKINPAWDHERLFQEARRIVIAQIQHITYNEYLPIILGPQFTRVFGINLLPSGYFTGYNPQIRPIVSSEFAAAAYRFGHSLIQGNLDALTANHQLANLHGVLGDNFNNVTLSRDVPQGNDMLLLGMANQKMRSVDPELTKEITERLYKAATSPDVGLDLFAINVHRGRDNGVPPYNDWREYCGFDKINSFDDLAGLVEPGVINKLKSLYDGSVEDIDLYPAGLAEKPMFGSLIGPTFSCMIAEQFRRLRNGDRFWYENGNTLSSFSPAQLSEIRKTSLARVMCDNLDIVETIQPLVLQAPTLINKRVRCKPLPSELPSMDLNAFSESDAVVFPDSKTSPIQRPPGRPVRPVQPPNRQQQYYGQQQQRGRY